MARRVYLNQAGTSWPKAPGVAEAVQRTLLADPLQHGALFAESRDRIAAALGLTHPEDLLLTPGCTSALSTLLHALSWQPGDIVVTSAVEHEAMLGPIAALVRLRGIEHRRVGYTPGAPFDLPAYEALLQTGRVRAVAVTAASNVTGECLPVETIASAARRAGAFCLVDAAQTTGISHLQLEALGADAVAFAGHKGPLAPQGIGGLWLRRSAEPTGCDLDEGRCTGASDLHHPLLQAPIGYCDLGSVNLAGAVAMATSLEWLASVPDRRKHAVALRNRLAQALRARGDCEVFGGDGPSTTAVSFRHATVPLAQAQQRFATHGIIVRAGRHCASDALRILGAPEGTIRVSFGVFNRDEDVDAVLHAL